MMDARNSARRADWSVRAEREPRRQQEQRKAEHEGNAEAHPPGQADNRGATLTGSRAAAYNRPVDLCEDRQVPPPAVSENLPGRNRRDTSTRSP